MSYRPDENDLMAYLYGELEGDEKQKFEQYLMHNAEARKKLEQLRSMQGIMGTLKDKEVIAPPIFVTERKQLLWEVPYFKTIVSIAASLLLLIMVGKYSGAHLQFTDREFKIGFGKGEDDAMPKQIAAPALTPQQVQQMINEAMVNNNTLMQASWAQSQEKLDASIKENLALNSGKIDQFVKEASTASQAQIQQYVSSLQTGNMQLVKDYFQLTSTDQKKYIEGLLIDFAKYLQQQRQDDMQLVQSRLNTIEQKTNVFKQETEQILTSIITTVGNAPVKETKY